MADSSQFSVRSVLNRYVAGPVPTQQQAPAVDPAAASCPSPALAVTSVAPPSADVAAGELPASPPALVPVKPHLRSAPGTAGKEKLPVTAEVIVAEYGKSERQSTRRALFTGGLVQSWLNRQPERPADEQLDRASALKVLRRKLLDARCDRRSCNIDRDLRCYHAARLLAGEAESLSISAIRQILPLLGRDEGQRWQLLPAYAEEAKALWARMLAERLSSTVVRAEVARILPRRSLSIRKRRPIRVGVLLKLLPRVRCADLAILIQRAKDLETEMRTAPRIA